MRRCLALSILWLLAALSAPAAEPSLEVKVEPPRLGVEDTARLVVRVVEPGSRNPQVKLGEMENLLAVAGPSVGTEFSFVNGVATSAMSFTYVLQPQEMGPARVGSVSVDVDGTVLRSKPIQVEVVAGSLAPARRQRSMPGWPFNDPGFGSEVGRQPQRATEIVLRQMVAEHKIYRGEPVAVTVALDSNVASIEAFEWKDAPSFPGWWTQRVDLPEQITPEIVEVDGTRFQRYVIARYVLVPLRSGQLDLPALTARIGVRSRGLFARQQVVERTADALHVRVVELPDPPEAFAGAVGELRYTATLEPRSIEIGASAELTVELSGKGNLPLVETPPLWPSCTGCDTYPPEEEDAVTVDASGIHGTRRWRMTVLPRETGSLELEPVILAVFDSAAGHYRRFTLGPMTLEVAPPPATPTPSPVPGATPTPAPAAAAAATPPSVGPGTTPWIWILVVVAAALGGAVLGGWLVARRSGGSSLPRRHGQNPSERARELQGALEAWWLKRRQEPGADALLPQMEELRRQLEAVRFAPGRADHSDTVADLERELRRFMRS